MWENQSPEPAEEQVAPKPTYEELEKLYANAVLDVEQKDRTLAFYRQKTVDYEYKVEKADEWITEEAREINLTSRQVQELCDILGLENEVTKTVTLSVEIEVKVTGARDADFDSISSYDFDIDVTSNSSDFEVESYDTDIDVRSVE